jgi:hypothetical protein
LWAALRAMAALTPVRRIVGLRAEKDRSWYLAAATGVLDGWRLRMATPPVSRTTASQPEP